MLYVNLRDPYWQSSLILTLDFKIRSTAEKFFGSEFGSHFISNLEYILS